MGLLFDTGIDVNQQTQVQQDIKKSWSYQTSNQITSTYAPQESIQYSPQLMFNSPGASILGASQAPTVQVIPLTQQTNAPALEGANFAEQGQSADKTSDNTIVTLLVLAGVGVVGYYLMRKFGNSKEGKAVKRKMATTAITRGML